ncbi:hypothetical protein FBR02_14815, partial [Anaerolineae bacterium CFX9]|nr:hypothetical protein [Anaerolineae bacterium CFX9]
MKRVLVVGLLLVLVLSVGLVQAQGTVIKIASQTPLSGPQSVLGISMRNATELAINQLSGDIAA